MTDATGVTARSKEDSRGLASVRPLHIVIPGGEGHLGRILASYLSARGHAVTTLSRSTRAVGSSEETSAAWKSLRWDGKSPGDWGEALEHADVLINLAGRTVNCRYNAKNRDEILRSRVDSTRILGQAIQKMSHGPRVWLNASTATIYRHSFDREMDEANGETGGNEADAPASWRFSIDVAAVGGFVFRFRDTAS
jgi:NAD dependent epimerase/dehydratase family enzyme